MLTDIEAIVLIPRLKESLTVLATILSEVTYPEIQCLPRLGHTYARMDHLLRPRAVLRGMKAVQ